MNHSRLTRKLWTTCHESEDPWGVRGAVLRGGGTGLKPNDVVEGEDLYNINSLRVVLLHIA